MRFRTLIAGLALLAAAHAARAVLPDEIQVYTDDVNAPGELGMELHVNTTPSGRRTPDFPNEVTPHHGLRVTPEFSLGLAPGVDAGLYLPMTRDAEGRVLFGGPKVRLKWLPLRPPEDGAGWFAGLNGEYAWLNANFETTTRSFELRPILGWRDTRWLFSMNPVLDRALNGPDRGGRPEFAPAFKAARSVASGLALGLEYYADLGPLGRPLPHSQQAHTLYAAMEWEHGPVPIHFAIGRGLTDATDKWTVKAILEFAFGGR
ncbi:MAG: hypothetical protein ACRET8_06310 [Burkholderiales bacterium]